MALFTVGEQHGRRHADGLGEAHARCKVRDANELIGSRIRQRLDQDAIHYGEDRRRGADAQGQRQGRSGREHGLATEGAEPVTQRSGE